MARQELSNIFQDGLISDLNPINTPKSVLTDCLNGTYITYNGNEFVLQNDMGNYKLKNCKLPTNFIPVGVKGYADILYIVSYNPFTKEVEIGSYPAPQSIFTTGDSESVLAENEDLDAFFWTGDEEYTSLIKDNKKPLFIFAGTPEENTKLNPGDEFKLTGLNTEKLEFYYQHLNFYVIDEDNKLYDLEDEDLYYYNGNKWNGTDYRKVFWETPGWLAAQYDLYVPDKFNLNLRSLNVPEFLIIDSGEDEEVDTQAEGDIPLDDLEPDSEQYKVSMDLSSQTIISDLLFQAELNEHYNGGQGPFEDLYIRYLIKTGDPASTPESDKNDYGIFKGIVYDNEQEVRTGETETNETGTYTYFDIPVWKHNYQDDIITAYNNIKSIWFYNNPGQNPETGEFDIANYRGVVELTAYPVIKVQVETDNGIDWATLKFTQFSTTQRFPLNTLKNSNAITIADSIYKWSVDDDSCTISFNINGPFINASDITGRYEIYRINLFNNKKWPNLNTKPDLNNPESYSKWTGLNKKEKTDKKGILKFNETLNKWEFQETLINNSHFVDQEKVLMCEGKLSNLVLYGQNTLNINWDLSNEYELTEYQNRYTNPDYNSDENINADTNPGYLDDTSFVGYDKDLAKSKKTIDFSKEGGIYIFRVILEQGDQQLAESRQVLIPSEVFNEWFGSIDDYNNIYENQWIEKYKNSISCTSFSILNLSPIFTNNAFIFYNETPITEDTDFSSLFDTFNDHISDSAINRKDQLNINYSKAIAFENVDILQNFNNQKGNLWNSKINNTLELLQNSEIVLSLITNNFIDYTVKSFLNKTYDIIYKGDPKSIYTYTPEDLYPEQKSLKSLGIHVKTWNSGGYNRPKIGGQFFYPPFLYENTDYIGGGVEARDWTCDTTQSLFGDPMALFDSSGIRVGYFGSCVCSNHDSNTYCWLTWGDANGGIDKNTIIWNGRQSGANYVNRCLVFPAANQRSANSKDGAVIVVFASTADRDKALTILRKFKLRNYSTTPTDIWGSYIQTSLSLDNKTTYAINKLNINSKIDLLSIDDQIISFNSKLFSINNDFNLLYLTNSLWENIKKIPNISINYIIDINWTSDAVFNNLYLNFNSEVEKYNHYTDQKLKESENIPTDTWQYIDIGDLEEILDPMVYTLRRKLKGLHGNALSTNNVCWDNQTWTTTIGFKTDNWGGIVAKTGKIIFTYIETYSVQTP